MAKAFVYSTVASGSSHTKGDVYGTTEAGGKNGAAPGDGTVFKITAGGKETPIYSFCSQSGCADGAAPTAGLIQATDGDLYGTTVQGGANGVGTVFKITLDGKLKTLWTFCSHLFGKARRGQRIALSGGATTRCQGAVER